MAFTFLAAEGAAAPAAAGGLVAAAAGAAVWLAEEAATEPQALSAIAPATASGIRYERIFGCMFSTPRVASWPGALPPTTIRVYGARIGAV